MKQRSKHNFFYDYPDGSGITTQCYVNGEFIQRSKQFESLAPDTIIEVKVRKFAVDNVIQTPIGAIPNVSDREVKEFEMTPAQYYKFIALFWENGPEYFDQI